jgi:hypothetical protein
MSFLADTPAKLLETRAAIAQAKGYPTRAQHWRWDENAGRLVNVTCDPKYDAGIPCVWEPEIIASDDGTIAAMELPADAEQHLGKTVRVAGKDVTLPARSALLATAPVKVQAVIDSRKVEIDPTRVATKTTAGRTP